MTSRPLLRFEDKLHGEDRYLARLASPEHGRFARNALVAAAVIHAALLLLPAAKLRALPLPAAAPRSAPAAAIWRSMPSLPAKVSTPAAAAPPVLAEARRRAPEAASGGTFALRVTIGAPVGFALLPPPRDPVPEPPPHVDPALLAADPDLLFGAPEPPAPGVAGGGPAAVPDAPAVLVPESRVVPEFPERARELRLGATVVVAVEIGEDGAPIDIRVARCSRPNLGFERAAIRAVEQWRWKPATSLGRPVRSRVEFPLEFKP